MKGLVRGSFYSFLLRSVGHLIRFSVGVLLARCLGPATYGAYSYAITIIALISIPAILGMDHILLRFIPKYLNDSAYGRIKGIVHFANGVSAISIALVSAVALAIVAFFTTEYRAVNFLIFATLPLIILGQVRQAVVRAFHHPVLAQFPENIIYPGVNLVVLLIYAYLLQRTVSGEVAAWSNLAAWVVTFVVGYAIYRAKCRSYLSVESDQGERAEWISPATGLITSGLSFILLSRGEILMLGQLVSKHDLGIYTAAARGAEMIQFAYEAISLGGASLFSSVHARGDRLETQRFVTRVTDIIFWVTLPAFLFLFYFANPILGFFGHDYVAAAGAFRILISLFFVSSLSGFIIVMLYIAGHQAAVAKATLVLAAVNVVLARVLIPMYGIEGAAISCGTVVLALKMYLVFYYYKSRGILSLPSFIAYPAGVLSDGKPDTMNLRNLTGLGYFWPRDRGEKKL